MAESQFPLPTIRWGIIGAGAISAAFVKDITLPREHAQARHIVSAIGTSSLEKAKSFVQDNIPSVPTPHIYSSYEGVLQDVTVDVVYICTPHAFHKKNCLDAIAAGKHVLCEKAFAITAHEAEEVFAAATAKNVYVMEAMWTRFHPLVQDLRKVLFTDKLIGDIRRTFCDFGQDHKLASLGPESRLKNLDLGAGSLLNIGIYSLTWGLLTLDERIGMEASHTEILANQSLVDGVDVATAILLRYPATGRQGILTSTSEFKNDDAFCRIEGTEGYVLLSGPYTSSPRNFSVWRNRSASNSSFDGLQQSEPVFQKGYDDVGFGLYREADAVALDLAAGRRENKIMPHAETLRIMRMLDEIRRQGGASFPQDSESSS
ncbi:oxidoreductase [Paraphaeosphaeria sporulosa]